MLWTIAENEDYLRGVAHCGGARSVDEAIAPIMYALARRPLGFDETEVNGVYLARTKLRINGPDFTLSHSVWFRPVEAIKTVELLWIEVTAPDAMGDDLDYI
ncbi:hypothetical protein [Paracoccus haematequi]|nr:hypothetical protein [Paracoccus haematequi]